MVVTMVAMGMMQMAIYQIIDMIAMGDRLMPTVRTVDVICRVAGTGVLRGACCWIMGVNGQDHFIDVVFMGLVQVPIMQIGGLTLNVQGQVPTVRAMGMGVFGVNGMCHFKLLGGSGFYGVSLACARAFCTSSVMC